MVADHEPGIRATVVMVRVAGLSRAGTMRGEASRRYRQIAKHNPVPVPASVR